MITPTPEPTEERPYWSAHPSDDGSATRLWHVTVNEGWRSSVVCSGMYEWAARWLVEQLQGKPYAQGFRPGEKFETTTRPVSGIQESDR
jgi:hypothetical protein